MEKIKKLTIWLGVLSLSFETAGLLISGHDVKLWMFISLIGGGLVLVDILKKKHFKKEVSFPLIILGFLLISLPGIILYSPILPFSFQQWVVLALISMLAIFFYTQAKKYSIDIYLALTVGYVITCVFSIYQNIAFELGLPHGEVMAARPNGFFPEPDWLGIYLVLTLAFYLPFLANGVKKKILPKILRKDLVIEILVLLGITTLIITVARASWLAFITEVGIISLLLASSEYKNGLREFFLRGLKYAGKVFFLFIIALAVIYSFKLTRFDLPDRFISIFSGEHVITVAQNPHTGEKFKIDLEEKNQYIDLGYTISEEYISDVNVESRQDKAKSSWDFIKEHSMLGNGLGIILIATNFEHNANNLYLEWWVSAGLPALILLLLTLIYISAIGYGLYKKNNILGQIILAGIGAFIIVNIFNATIFLPIAWFIWAWAFAQKE